LSCVDDQACDVDHTELGAETCDVAWDEYGLSCAVLEADYSWDCTGCECPGDGCSGTESYIGDGYCDSQNNNEACSYDGGDCCEETCVDSTYACGSNGYSCVNDGLGTFI